MTARSQPRTAVQPKWLRDLQALADGDEARSHDETAITGGHHWWRCMPIAAAVETVYVAIEAEAAALDVERASGDAALREALNRLANAAEMLSHWSKRPDDPAYRSWFRPARSDVDREVGLARAALAAANPAPEPLDEGRRYRKIITRLGDLMWDLGWGDYDSRADAIKRFSQLLSIAREQVDAGQTDQYGHYQYHSPEEIARLAAEESAG